MYSRISRFFLLVVFLLAAVGASSGVFAQDITASVSGFVTDSAGAAVNGASVTVTNVATGEQRKTTTDDSGQYTVSGLTVGTYTVVIEQKGFKKYVQENVVLHVNDKTPVNAELSTGNVQEVVTVTAGAPMVKTETHTVEGLLTGEQIRELPLNNRNFAQLTQLVAGVSSSQGSTVGFGGLSTVAISVNGGRTTAINWSIDGARNVDTGSNATLFNYPSVDAIAEFKILTNSYDAQFGRNAGGVVNVVTRGGTKEFHGGLYEFLRNDVLQARSPFQTTPLRGLSPNNCFSEANPENDPDCKYKGPLRYNNFGYNVGGPVWIPKLYSRGHDATFFFFSEEFRRQRGVSVLSGLYPTEAQRNGIFATAIKDPVSGSNFSNNQIPNNRIDSNAKAIMASFMPLPNSPSEGPNNFRTVASSPADFRQELLRVDHSFNDNWRIYGRYVHDLTSTVEPGGLFNGLIFPGVATTATTSPADNVVIRLSTVLSPTLLNEVGYDFARNAITSVLTGNALRSNFTDINIPEIFSGSPSGALPAVAITGFSSPLGVLAPFQNDNPSHTFSDNVTWTRGAHTFKFGGLFSFEAKNENSQGASTPGSFSFTGNATGNAFADFLLGRARTYTEDQTDVTVHERFRTYEWYAQDSWKVRRNVTIDLGVRHSIFLNPYDKEDLLISFLPQLFDPAKAVKLAANGTIIAGSGDRFNGIIFANDNSPYGKYVQTNHYNTIGPRIGFAWDTFSDGKMAVRGGFGIYYDRSLIGIVEQNAFSDPKANQRVSIDNTFLSTPAGGAPNTSIFPIGLTATGDPFKVPTIIQWSLGIQRELTKDTVVELTYAGSHGYHLLHQFQINQPRPLVAAQQGVGLNFVRPFIGFAAINMRETTANSSYNSLQASFRKRMSHGLLFNASYTFAKTLTDSSDDRGNTPQDSLNFRSERGRAAFQRAHVLNLSYLWEVPFPKDAPAHLNAVLGGWQIAGATFFWSGLPLTVTQGGDLLGVGLVGTTGITRPNVIADPEGPKTVAQWFNTSAFAPATTTFGTAGRGIITGPGVNNWDISLVKNFRWRENLRLRFSTDFVNAFNHQNLGNPNVTPTYDGTLKQTNTNFGRITSLSRDPRIIQFGLKFNF